MVRLLRRLPNSVLLALTALLLLCITSTTVRQSPSRPIAAADPKHAIAHSFNAAGIIDIDSFRSNCQIIYVLGVEGSLHHGFMPVIKALAEQQIDPATGVKYHVVKGHDVLRATIFGSKEVDLPMHDPQLVQATLDSICPPNMNQIGAKHIILEGNSFPSGRPDDIRLPFRVRRQKSWQKMTPDEIASSQQALNHPTNLYELYNAFSPYVDVRFVVLHRPYLDTIASHAGFDAGPVQHSTVISGFLLLLSRFLLSHLYTTSATAADIADGVDGYSGNGMPLWTVVCSEQLSSKEFETQRQLLAAREQIVSYLATFLGWPQQSCPQCFDSWRESGKASPEERLGTETTNKLLNHVKMLEGIWPPRRIEDSLPQQQCRM